MKFSKVASTLAASLVMMSMFSVSAQAKGNELKGGSPEVVDMNADKLNEIDAIVEQAIANGVTPGAVVLVTKDNRIIKESSYGYAQKYDMGTALSNPVKMTKKTIFDLASVTKVMATTQGIMKLVSEGTIQVEDRVSDYLPDFAQNGKELVTIEDLLTHTSGLTPWEPTYLYAQNSEEVLDYINKLPLEYETGTQRKYSDFSFMMLGFIIESVTGQRLDEYLENEIYSPLKMKDTMFNASQQTNKQIAATSWGNPYEYKMIDDPNFGYFVPEDADFFGGWRDYTLIGEVNDGNSFYGNGGIAGHAGLFSTARDLAVLGQTLLNKGSYGKVNLFDPQVVEDFTRPQKFGQGYGWELNQGWYMGYEHSGEAYGHTGFTGTQIILDPVYNLQVIILTNKQNNGPLESGSYPSTGLLSREVVTKVYESLK